MFRYFPLLIGFGLLCAAALPLFNSGIFFFDLLSHFPTYGCSLAGVMFVVSLFWWRRRVVRWGLALLVGAALANGAWLLPYWPASGAQAEAGAPDLRIAQLNVLVVNRNFPAVITWLRRVRPHILVVEEVDTGWVKAISALSDLFPYSISRPRPDNFGIAVFSRFPITHSEAISLPIFGVPALLTRLDVAGRPVRLAAVHTIPPKTQRFLTSRNLSFKVIANWAAAEPDTPTLVVGDLNCTPFAAPFRDFLDYGGLEDARVGRGLHQSFPFRLPALLRIPIDFILHNAELKPLSLTSGPPLGSDHLPLVGDYKFVR